VSLRIQATELNPRSALVVAAHPDDEALGCGGTIARLAGAGVEVHLAFLADGVTARATDDGGAADPAAEIAARRAAAEEACRILGAASVSFDDLPDNRLDSVPLLQICKRVEGLLAQRRPDTVLTHHGGDVNVDHRRVHEAVIVACRPQPAHCVSTLLFFEVPSSTEWQPPGSAPAFLPNWFVDISASLACKLAALDAYKAELRSWPHPRSRQAVEHLARWRGASIGVDAAEAFVLGRQLF
jgi:N-acetylglucosamine malate deacetylase 1